MKADAKTKKVYHQLITKKEVHDKNIGDTALWDLINNGRVLSLYVESLAAKKFKSFITLSQGAGADLRGTVDGKENMLIQQKRFGIHEKRPFLGKSGWFDGNKVNLDESHKSWVKHYGDYTSKYDYYLLTETSQNEDSIQVRYSFVESNIIAGMMSDYLKTQIKLRAGISPKKSGMFAKLGAGGFAQGDVGRVSRSQVDSLFLEQTKGKLNEYRTHKI
jgi:hypothetical protein